MSPPDYSDAECRRLPPDLLEGTFWYPGPGKPETAPTRAVLTHWTAAKAVCHRCPLEYMCLEDFLSERYGVYGGLDQHERYLERHRRAKRRQKAARAAREAVGWTEAADVQAAA